MTAEVIQFPYADQPRSAEQSARAQPSIEMEASAMFLAIARYRDAKAVPDRTRAMHEMRRIFEFGSEGARLAVRAWWELVLGPQPDPPVLVEHDPFEGVPGGFEGFPTGSDYAD